ncbi:MAG: L,D-transpeptidase family protein [Rhodospirillaceae bacterium]
MIYAKALPVLIGCALTAATALLAPGAGAEGLLVPDARPVLERWSQAIALRLSQTDPAAAAIAPAVGSGQRLKPGASGERVDRLAAQMRARGFLAADAYHGVYDLALEAAVAAFQTNEGILADGLAGESTIDSLDRTSAATAIALKTTLDGLRSLAAEAPDEFFLVNIAAQSAYLIQKGVVTMSMRTAVGRPSRPTPLLTDHVTDIVVNPTWTAPTTVLAKDKLPSLRRTGHPGIEGATIYVDHVEVDPATVDWNTVTPERVRIVQSAGDNNALGRVKFNLTNGQSIYMHDTNDHSVFARQGRALSSGCVRLAEPRQLAETLLGREGWSHDRIEQSLDSERTQYIPLRHTLPVRMVYWQASVDDAGVVRIHKDIYGRNSPGLASTSRQMQTVQIARPRQLVVGLPVRSAAAAQAPAVVPAAPSSETAWLEGLFSKLMAFVPTLPPAPASQQVASSDAAPLVIGRATERVAAQEAAPADRAHCTESCGWGLY